MTNPSTGTRIRRPRGVSDVSVPKGTPEYGDARDLESGALHLLQLAVEHRRRQNGENTVEDRGALAVWTLLKTETVLGNAIRVIQADAARRQQYATAVRLVVAVWDDMMALGDEYRKKVTSQVSEPARRTLRLELAAKLGTKLREHAAFTDAQLTHLAGCLTRKQKPGRELYRALVRPKGPLDVSWSDLERLQTVVHGGTQKVGFVRTESDAEALFQDAPPRAVDQVRYVLDRLLAHLLDEERQDVIGYLEEIVRAHAARVLPTADEALATFRAGAGTTSPRTK